MRIAVLASGEGTTLQAIIDTHQSGTSSAQLVLVLSNNRQSGALRRANDAGIATAHLSSLTHAEPAELDSAILARLVESQVELVVLTGYLKKIGPRVLEAFKGRIVNTHPSLLPRHGGQGMYGRRVHEAVLASGEAETGVSVHLVDAEYDTGAVVAQISLSVEPSDTADSLTEKVQAVERQFLVATIEALAFENAQHVSSNPSIERTGLSQLRWPKPAAHVER